MNREEIRDLALSWLDDINGGYFTPVQMNRYINLALKDAQRFLIQGFENRYLKCQVTILVDGQSKYSLPTDFLKVNWLEIRTSGDSIENEEVQNIEHIPISQKDYVFSNKGTPAFYFFEGDYICLRPIPDSAKTMRLYYTYRVSDMTGDTDEPDLPEEYHEYLALRAAKYGFVKDNRVSTNLDVEIARYEDSMRKDAENRNVDRARGIVKVFNGGGGVLF